MSIRACIRQSNNFFDVCTLPDILSIALDAGLIALVAPIFAGGIQALYKDCKRLHHRSLQRIQSLHLFNNNSAAVNANEQSGSSLTYWLGLS